MWMKEPNTEGIIVMSFLSYIYSFQSEFDSNSPLVFFLLSLHRISLSFVVRIRCRRRQPRDDAFFADLKFISLFNPPNTRNSLSGILLQRFQLGEFPPGSESFIDMKDNLAEELYGESLQLSKPGLDSASHCAYGSNFGNEDGSFWGSSDEESSRASLGREWERRHEEFHAIGYRDGIIDRKEAAAQEGFNMGFKQSVLAGYRFGLVRGISR